MTGSAFDHDVFLSFASAETEAARGLFQKLSQGGLRVFWSTNSLKAVVGQSFFGPIQESLLHSQHLLLYWSASAKSSPWVQLEYETFYSQCHLQDKSTRRLVILMDGREPISTLPPFLRNIQVAGSVQEVISLLSQRKASELEALKAPLEASKQRLADREQRAPIRIIAVDWSGAKKDSRREIWLAEARRANELSILECGRSREEICNFLIEECEKDSNLVVGLDFAFSFPSWFVKEKGCANAFEFWECVKSEGEGWLSQIRPPFFTKGGWPREKQDAYRLTEWGLKKLGKHPETVFKLVGAKQVGPGSIRGMPILHKLRTAGFKIWPFDPPEMPLVVEIYPRLFYDTVVKSSIENRVKHLAGYPDLEELHRTTASGSDSAFDAAISALQLFKRSEEIAKTEGTSEPRIKLEGQIWH